MIFLFLITDTNRSHVQFPNTKSLPAQPVLIGPSWIVFQSKDLQILQPLSSKVRSQMSLPLCSLSHSGPVAPHPS